MHSSIQLSQRYHYIDFGMGKQLLAFLFGWVAYSFPHSNLGFYLVRISDLLHRAAKYPLRLNSKIGTWISDLTGVSGSVTYKSSTNKLSTSRGMEYILYPGRCSYSFLDFPGAQTRESILNIYSKVQKARNRNVPGAEIQRITSRPQYNLTLHQLSVFLETGKLWPSDGSCVRFPDKVAIAD
jgi:hypothetical protein